MRPIARRGRLFGGALALGVLFGAGLVETQQAEVSASKAWVKLPAAGETTAEAFVVVKNPTMYDVYLLSVTTDIAEKVEIRRKTDEAVAELTVPAYGSVIMDPDGVRLRLVGLKRPLEEGQSISLTLKTDGSSTMTVSAVVRKE